MTTSSLRATSYELRAGNAEPSDEELMARCRQGDDRAMDLLVARYYARLFRFAHRMLGEREAAEDVAQQALLLAYRNVRRFRLERRFATWILAIAANLCRTEGSRRARRGRREAAVAGWSEGSVEEPVAPQSVEAAALRRLEGERVQQALHGLSPEHRLAVVLFYYEGMSHTEIASVCGCAVGTVKSRLHYALARLRRLLCSLETG
jgi:RNA polymerase sigma-70 factor (ECF subfamily)